jgi:hypothetical protein
MDQSTISQTAKTVKIPVSLVRVNNVFITSDGEEVLISKIEKLIEGFTLLKWNGGFGLLDNRAIINIKT